MDLPVPPPGLTVQRSAPLINLREFRATAKELFQEDLLTPGFDGPVDISSDEVKRVTPFERIEDAIQNALKGLEAVEEVSAVQRACQSIEMPTFSSLSVLPDLQTLRQQRNPTDNPHNFESVAKSRSRDAGREGQYVYNNVLLTQQKPSEPKPFEPVDADEVVLSVAFYHPTKRVKTQEFLVLGCQSLSALKDAFYCLSDHVFDGPQYHSGYFLIENTFYNDMRDPTNVDYSKYVHHGYDDFLLTAQTYYCTRTGAPTTPYVTQIFAFPYVADNIANPFIAKKMDDVMFSDISVRLGVQYLYMHQGNCEHIVVFNEVRMVHADDAKDRNAYPLLAYQSKIRRRKCRLCDIYPAKYVTYNDKLGVENPCFYCDHCYHPFHYSAEGKLLYNDFTVFPYYHEV